MEGGGVSPGWNGKNGEGDPYVEVWHLWKKGCPDVVLGARGTCCEEVVEMEAALMWWSK